MGTGKSPAFARSDSDGSGLQSPGSNGRNPLRRIIFRTAWSGSHSIGRTGFRAKFGMGASPGKGCPHALSHRGNPFCGIGGGEIHSQCQFKDGHVAAKCPVTQGAVHNQPMVVGGAVVLERLDYGVDFGRGGCGRLLSASALISPVAESGRTWKCTVDVRHRWFRRVGNAKKPKFVGNAYLIARNKYRYLISCK